MTAPRGQFAIEDTYWTGRDYVDAFERSGLTITTIAYPRPRDHVGRPIPPRSG